MFFGTVEKPPRLSEFELEIQALNDEGISNQEIFNYVAGTIVDLSKREDFLKLINVLKRQNKDEVEMAAVVEQFLTNSRARGANYSGGAGSAWLWAGIIAGVAAVTVITIVVITTTTGDDHECEDFITLAEGGYTQN